jgi:cytochrome P450
LISISDPVEHSKRRRLWDKAFTPSALKSYEVMLQARTQELVSCLSARAGPQKQIDVAQWLSFMALDFMGDFVFGGAFDFMEQGVDPTDFGKAGVKFFGVTEAWGMVPWSNAIFLALPKTTFPLHVKAEEALKKRRENPRGLRDLFYYLVSVT